MEFINVYLKIALIEVDEWGARWPFPAYWLIRIVTILIRQNIKTSKYTENDTILKKALSSKIGKVGFSPEYF